MWGLKGRPKSNRRGVLLVGFGISKPTLTVLIALWRLGKALLLFRLDAGQANTGQVSARLYSASKNRSIAGCVVLLVECPASNRRVEPRQEFDAAALRLMFCSNQTRYGLCSLPSGYTAVCTTHKQVHSKQYRTRLLHTGGPQESTQTPP